MVRTFSRETTLVDDRLTLALAPGLEPDGLNASPSFFHGFATHPQVLARGLVTLADITATRYYNFTPMAERDPFFPHTAIVCGPSVSRGATPSTRASR